jgi:hypothetical protein
MHGSTFPQYASNPEYDVTGNSYPKTGDLSPEGIREMYTLGQKFRSEYIEKQRFMPSTYNPSSIYLQSLKDQPSLMSAYAFMLGVYPESTSFLNLQMSNALEHQKVIRKTLGLPETPPRTGSAVSISSDAGFLFWTNPAQQCPSIDKKMQYHIASAGQALGSGYNSNLFPLLASQFRKPQSKINFATAHLYLDDYITAQKLRLAYPKFRNQESMDKLIEEYERDYFYEGLLGGNEIARVIATPLLNFAMIKNFGKSQIESGVLIDASLKSLQHAHFFSNEIGFAALLKAIGYPQGSAPKGGQNIRFELFETDGKMYVRTTLDGQPLNFSESEQGIFTLDDFLRVLYPLMYFGDIDQVCAGREEMTMNVYPKCQDYEEYLSQYVSGVQLVDAPQQQKVKKCHMSQRMVPRQVLVPEKTNEHKVNLVNVGYVEIVQRAPAQRSQIQTRVIERKVQVPVQVPVRVVEEKIVIQEVPKVVVHEVDRLITEPPTHIHHIKMARPIERNSTIPNIFIEEEPASGYPWWLWLIPLLCYIPCIALLCCRKRKPAPIVKPKQPMAPIVAKPLSRPKEKEIMVVRTEERHSPERKYVIEKKVIDEAEDIEKEIDRQLKENSRAVRESRQARAYSHGRQTAAEIANEGNMARGSGGGRRKRIKTIKKFGEVIGKEIQYLDEDGNVTRTERVGLDANEAYGDEYGGYPQVIAASEAEYVSGRNADHVFRDTYERDAVEPTSSAAVNDRRNRRGYGSGGGFGSGGGLGSGGGYSSGRNVEAAGYNSGSNVAFGEPDTGRYSQSKGSRGSHGSAGRKKGEFYAHDEFGDNI